ncbi:hypothetical protein EVAR_93050_1 [Eumeta japonica]|uniref:Uncharacterized protein n=1 Tax=Eumeta variegata TaxID=151549 RepID=A0A4C1TFU2_EUMVA|nr:hypothetical protein EVAR_93050_1 [Eumeta japonica]
MTTLYTVHGSALAVSPGLPCARTKPGPRISQRGRVQKEISRASHTRFECFIRRRHSADTPPAARRPPPAPAARLSQISIENNLTLMNLKSGLERTPLSANGDARLLPQHPFLFYCTVLTQ